LEENRVGGHLNTSDPFEGGLTSDECQYSSYITNALTDRLGRIRAF
jgi:hypothetical protein